MPDSAVPFLPFGAQHLLGLATIAGLVAAVAAGARFVASAGAGRPAALTLAMALVAHESFKVWFRVVLYDQPVAQYLPLHLCGLSSLLMAWVLARRSYGVFEVAYFWGLGGSLAALLMPDLQRGFPSLAFVAFFVGHGLVLASLAFAIAAFGFRPTFRSLVKTAGITLLYMLVIAPVNFLIDANYLYLRHKPGQATIIDALGPWPWYILPLSGIGVLVCLLCYLPFALAARRRKAAGS